MFGLDMLDVAIGVIFVFLLLSLICSALTEMIEAFMKQRAYELEKGIKRMLLSGITGQADSEAPESGDLVTKLYNHQLISALYDGTYGEAKKTGARMWPKLPSYIPSRNFALALLDLLSPKEDAKGQKDLSIEALRESIMNNAPPLVKEALLPLIDAAEKEAGTIQEKLEMIRKGIEQWYDSAMDRVTSFYKRRVQYFTFAIGLAVAIGLNADTIEITDSLVHDPALRTALVSTAQEYAKENPAPTPKPTAAPETGNTPEKPGAATPPAPGKTEEPANPAANGGSNSGENTNAANKAAPAKSTAANKVNNAENTPPDQAKNPCADPKSAECTAATDKCNKDPKGPGCDKILCGDPNSTKCKIAKACVDPKSAQCAACGEAPDSDDCKVAKACADDKDSPNCKLETNLARIKGLGLPMGWDWTSDHPEPQGWEWLLKILGWIITAIAVSLGAPFWFDLLNKFMMVRSTIKPDEKKKSP